MQRSRTTVLAATAMLFALVAAACGGGGGAPSFESTFGGVETPSSGDAPASDDPASGETASNEPANGETASGETASGDAPSEGGAPDESDTDGDDAAGPAEAPPVEIPDSLDLKLTTVVDLDRPLDLATRPGDDHLYIATKGGLVVKVQPTADGGTIVGEVVDISGIIDDGFESGLLGIEFSPDGDTFYLSYSDRNHDNTIVEIDMRGDEFALETGRTLLTVEQPRDNHNGGDIDFGPDGMLYVALGDGGGSGDPDGNAQDTSTLLGAILRIDPAGEPYAIPPDNPFAEGGGAPEIFLYGVRNPWRNSFDRLTGDLWVADVGENDVEEVTVLYRRNGGGNGSNLGWNLVEGDAPFAAPGPPATGYDGPIFTYPRSEGCSVTGGHVYRGEAIPELQGIYIFGDYCEANIWGIASSQSQGFVGRFDLGIWPPSEGLASFGEGPSGETYVLTFPSTVYRIDPA